MEFLGDLAGFLPLPDELEYLQLAVAEPLDWRFLDVGLPADLLLQHFSSEGFADVYITAEHTADRRNDFVQSFLLHEVAQSPGAESNLSVNRFIMGADHQHGQTGILRFDIAHQFQPAAVLKRNIGDD